MSCTRRRRVTPTPTREWPGHFMTGPYACQRLELSSRCINGAGGEAAEAIVSDYP
jgi:hypothetical protein